MLWAQNCTQQGNGLLIELERRQATNNCRRAVRRAIVQAGGKAMRAGPGGVHASGLLYLLEVTILARHQDATLNGERFCHRHEKYRRAVDDSVFIAQQQRAHDFMRFFGVTQQQFAGKLIRGGLQRRPLKRSRCFLQVGKGAGGVNERACLTNAGHRKYGSIRLRHLAALLFDGRCADAQKIVTMLSKRIAVTLQRWEYAGETHDVYVARACCVATGIAAKERNRRDGIINQPSRQRLYRLIGEQPVHMLLLHRRFALLWLQLAETIADTALRQNIFGMRRIAFQLLTQIGDIEPQRLRLTAIFMSPDLREQHIMRQQSSGIVDEMIEQAVFGGSERHLLAAYPDLALAEVYRQVVVHNDARLARGLGHEGAPQQRLDTRLQFLRAERLGQVIVGADLQAANPVGLLLAHG